MKVRHPFYGIITLINILFSLGVAAQCEGDNIVKYVNSDAKIQDVIRKTFKIKRSHRPIVINADTSFVYWNMDFRFFKDSLIHYGYSKKIVDSLAKVSLKSRDTLVEIPPFCGQYNILNDENYNPQKYNLVLMLNQYNDSIVIGQLIYCYDEYYGASTLRKSEFIHLMFLLDEKGEIMRVIIIPDKDLCNQPIFR